MKSYRCVSQSLILLIIFIGALAVNLFGSTSVSIDKAEKMLKDGNKRFWSGKMKYPNLDESRMAEVSGGQNPWATVITCSDSRVPVEQVFDAGLGDIFVIRVAGNVCDVDEVGSIEYGVDHLGTPIMVVLGHTNCGAVTAVVTEAEVHGSIPPLVDNIAPAVEKAKKYNPDLHGKALVPKAVEANVWQSIDDLFKNSPAVRKRVKEGKLKVVGAIYQLEDGKVNWLGQHPREKFLLAYTNENHHFDRPHEYYQNAHWYIPDVSHASHAEGYTYKDVMNMLKKGNQRYVDNNRQYPHLDHNRIQQVTGVQNPYATVITCSDSRVPVEHIFDAGLGDIFTVRVAGNVCDVDEIGSIEYGIGHLYTPVLVVLGHSSCGAVTAVVTDAEVHGSIPPLVDNIIPAVQKAESEYPDLHGKALIPEAVKANVWQSIDDLFKHSPEACKLVESGYLRVEGAVYHLDDGHVEWLGTHPEQYAIIESSMSSFEGYGDAGHGSGHDNQTIHSSETSHVSSDHSSSDYSSGSSHSTSSEHDSYSGGSSSYNSGSSHDNSSTNSYSSSSSTHDYSSAATHSNSSISHKRQNSVNSAISVENNTSLIDQWWFWIAIVAFIVGGFMMFLIKLGNGSIKARINVGTKIIAGFCVVLVMIAISVFISSIKMSFLGSSINALSEEFLPLTEKIATIESNALEQELNLNAFLIDHDDHRANLFHEFGSEVEKEISDAEKIINQSEHLKQSGAYSSLEKIKSHHMDFEKRAEEVVSLARTGKNLSEYSAVYESVEQEGEEIVAELDGLLMTIEHSLDSVAHHAEVAETAGFNLILIIGFCAFLTAIGVGVFLSQSISRPLKIAMKMTQKMNEEFKHFVEIVNRIANNDLTVEIEQNNLKEIDVHTQDEVGMLVKSIDQTRESKREIGESLSRMVKNLSRMIHQINSNAEELVSAAGEVASSSEQMSRGISNQNDQLGRVSSAVEEMSASIEQASRNSAEAANTSKEASNSASEGGQVVSSTMSGMKRIEDVVTQSSESISKLSESAEEIGKIISVIDDIADQTNLLALNAAIEAARAGEQGRGFAVVADEVRNLAERTARSTGEITEMVKNIQLETKEAVESMELGKEEVSKGRELAEKAANSLSGIVGLSQGVMNMIQQLSTASEEQATTSQQITQSVAEITGIVKETAVGAEQSAAAAEELNRQAESLKGMVNQFKVR